MELREVGRKALCISDDKIKYKNAFESETGENLEFDFELIKIFPVEIYWHPSKTYCFTNKSEEKCLEDTWSMDSLDLKDPGPKDFVFSFNIVVLNNFSKLEWTVLLKF